MAAGAAPDDVARYPVTERLGLMRWLTAAFIVLAIGVGFFAGRHSLTEAALIVAALPAMYSFDVPRSRGARRNWLRVGLVVASSASIGLILWSQHSDLPTWLVVAGGIYALLGLPAAGLDLVLALNPQLRAKMYERRKLPSQPTNRP
jgi:hypothetical protein